MNQSPILLGSGTGGLNLTIDTTGFLLQNQRLGTRKYTPSEVGLPKYLDDKRSGGCVLPRIIWPGMPSWGNGMAARHQWSPAAADRAGMNR
jgi:hypothetical protein